MPLQKDFKVKDTLNVGISGLFGDGVRIGETDNYISTLEPLLMHGDQFCPVDET